MSTNHRLMVSLIGENKKIIIIWQTIGKLFYHWALNYTKLANLEFIPETKTQIIKLKYSCFIYWNDSRTNCKVFYFPCFGRISKLIGKTLLGLQYLAGKIKFKTRLLKLFYNIWRVLQNELYKRCHTAIRTKLLI